MKKRDALNALSYAIIPFMLVLELGIAFVTELSNSRYQKKLRCNNRMADARLSRAYSMDRVKVKLGRKVVSYNDEQLKSDLDLSTSLSAEKINEVAKETREKLSALTQPVYPHDIAAAAHFTLVEMGLKDEGNKYMSFLKKRRDNRFVPNVECHYIDCQICGVANSPENEKCSGCGALLDGKKIIFKAV